MPPMKTPGVYIVEKSVFPNSVVEVATAVPAFIGYTEKADNKGKSLANSPWRITSMAEFHTYFGSAPVPTFTIGEAPPAEGGTAPAKGKTKADVQTAAAPQDTAFSFKGTDYTMTQASGNYLLYYSMLLFFHNGGGPCYIVSIGKYGDAVEADKLQKGIGLLIKEQEPTMVVMPDAVLLDVEDCISTQQAALQHCGGTMKNRMAILDIHGGYRDRQDPAGDPIDNFRNALGINYLDFAASYYPWLNTTIVQDKDLSYGNIANADQLQKILRLEQNLPDTLPTIAATDTPADKARKAKLLQQAKAIADITSDWKDDEGNDQNPAVVEAHKILLNKTLIAMSPVYNAILKEIKDKLNLLPPSAAMAGVYTMVDNSRGVWKAPANVSLNAVTSPAVNITHDDQEDLNVTIQGKSINAIRPFIGEGTLVWGARTLDGNSLDWRYVNVRRTMIMLEESIRLATKAYVFEPNVATTWVTIQSMIRNFLTGIWKRGGLAGASPDDAFGIYVGLGQTMTPEDIIEGILRVTVLVAISRPAEFIEITFQQQMQKS